MNRLQKAHRSLGRVAEVIEEASHVVAALAAAIQSIAEGDPDSLHCPGCAEVRSMSGLGDMAMHDHSEKCPYQIARDVLSQGWR